MANESLTQDEQSALLEGVASAPSILSKDKLQYGELIKAYGLPEADAKAILSKETAPFLGQRWSAALANLGKGAFDLAVGVVIGQLFDQALNYASSTTNSMNKNGAKLIADLIIEKPYRAEVIKNALAHQIVKKIKQELKKNPLFKKADDMHISILIKGDAAIQTNLLKDIQSLEAGDPQLSKITTDEQMSLPITALDLAILVGNTQAKEKLESVGAVQKKSALLDAVVAARLKASKPAEKWFPSPGYRASVRANPQTYIREIADFLKSVREDASYAKKLNTEDPKFFNWLMRQH